MDLSEEPVNPVHVSSNILSHWGRLVQINVHKNPTFHHICSGLPSSGLATYWSTSKQKTNWKTNTGRQLRSIAERGRPDRPFKITGFLPSCCSPDDGDCMQKQDVCFTLAPAKAASCLRLAPHCISCHESRDLKDKCSSQDILPRLSFLAEEMALSIFLRKREGENINPPHYPKARRCQQSE